MAGVFLYDYYSLKSRVDGCGQMSLGDLQDHEARQRLGHVKKRSLTGSYKSAAVLGGELWSRLPVKGADTAEWIR